jgi:hypothetical protein
MAINLLALPQVQAPRSLLLDLAPINQALDYQQALKQQAFQNSRAMAQDRRAASAEDRAAQMAPLQQAQAQAAIDASRGSETRAQAMHPLDMQARRASIAATNAQLAQTKSMTPEGRAAIAGRFGIDVNTPEGRAFVLSGTYTPKTDKYVQFDPEKGPVYKQGADGTVAPANLPGMAEAGPSKKTFDAEHKLRQEYVAQPQVKEYQTVRNAYLNVTGAAKDPSAAGDLSMIFAYMKMLDPNSVVREQEFANAQNAAGVPDRIRNVYNRILAGERLNPNQRKDFISQAEKLHTSSQRQYEAVRNQFGAIAKKSGLRPDQIMVDYGIAPPAQAPQGQQPSAQQRGQAGAPAAVPNGWSIQRLD